MVGVAANVQITSKGIIVDICGDEFVVPLDKMDEVNMRGFGTFVLQAWKEHQEREIDRCHEMAKEFLRFEKTS